MSDLASRMKAVLGSDTLAPDIRVLFEEHMNTLINFGVKTFEDVLAVVQDQQNDVRTRIIASWVLGKIRDAKAVTPLLSAFKDHNAGLYWEAAKSLAQLGDKKSVRPLIDVLQGVEPTDKRIAAIHALGLIGDKRALKPLLHVLLLSGEDARVRGEAAEALSLLDDVRAIAALIKCLKDDSPEVRFWSAFALGEIGDGRALRALKRVAKTDSAVLIGWGSVKDEAVEAITSIETRLS